MGSQDIWRWLQNGILNHEIESLICAAEKQATWIVAGWFLLTDMFYFWGMLLTRLLKSQEPFRRLCCYVPRQFFVASILVNDFFKMSNYVIGL